MAELTPEERYEKRLEQEKPVLDALLSWANEMQAKTAPKSALGTLIDIVGSFLARQYAGDQLVYIGEAIKVDPIKIGHQLQLLGVVVLKGLQTTSFSERI